MSTYSENIPEPPSVAETAEIHSPETVYEIPEYFKGIASFE